jgi:hypothetical protein
MSFASTSTEFALLDARTTAGAFVLPLSSDIPGRVINLKDPYGAFTRSTVTVYTQGTDTFEDGTNFRFLNNDYDFLQAYAGSTSRWYVTGGTQLLNASTSNATISTIQNYNFRNLVGNNFTNFVPAPLGEITCLDQVTTSTTAQLVSTFFELGNLNAQPNLMSTGGTFRWVMGTEPDSVVGNGLAFKFKRWNSFGQSNSPAFYGANMSTLLDAVVIRSQFMSTTLEVQSGNSNLTAGLANARLNFVTWNGTSGTVQVSHSIEAVYEGTGGASNIGVSFKRDGGPPILRLDSSNRRVGVLCNAPLYAFDVNGITRTAVPVSSITGTSATFANNSFGTYYYITNSSFATITINTSSPLGGWFVTLRNNTGAYLSCTVGGTGSGLPASPQVIAPATSLTMAWDSSTSAFVLF